MLDWNTTAFLDSPRREQSLPLFRLDGHDLRAATRCLLTIQATTSATSWQEMQPDIVDFWTHLAKAFAACLPASPPLNVIFMELRTESGLICAEMRDTASPMRATPLALSLSIPFLEAQAWSLPAPDEDEVAFDEGIAKLADSAKAAILAGFNDPAAQAALAVLKPFGIVIHLDAQPAENEMLTL